MTVDEMWASAQLLETDEPKPILIRYEHIKTIRDMFSAASDNRVIARAQMIQAFDKVLDRVGEFFPDEEIEIVVRRKGTHG
jgi:hypothetical protein